MSDTNLMEAPPHAGLRDAIHVAVVSLVADGLLYKGDRVKWHHRGISVEACDLKDVAIGIVNPFIEGHYNSVRIVWIMLYPNTVTGMKHHWSHPDFDQTDMDLDLAKSVIKNTAKALDLYDYDGEDSSDYLIELASHYCKRQSGCWPHDNYDLSPESWENFWKAYSVVTGNPRPTENRVPFRCAC